MFSKKYNSLFHESHSFRKLTVFPNVDVTPELAEELLRLNDGNRPIKDGTLKRYVSDMKSGKWEFNGDSIRISKTGRLMDGQHRLMSIIQSGCSQVFNIQTGLEENTFDTMDTGKNRSHGDVLAIMGIKNFNVVAGGIRLAAQYTQMKLNKSFSMIDRFALSNSQVVEWIEKHGSDRIQECAQIAVRCQHRSNFITQSTYCGLIYILGNKDWEAAKLFFEMVSTGENISSSSYSMIYLLRQKLINMQASKVMFKQSYEKHALIIKSWNYFREGKEIKQLTWQSDKEGFPHAI